MGLPIEVLVAGGIAVLAVLILLLMLGGRTRKLDLDRSEEGLSKPEWVQSSTPAETIEQLRADGESYQLFDRDPSERLAAPFAEQIEDIIHNLLQQSPELSDVRVDLGTAQDGMLEIWINETLYNSVDELPDEKIRQVFRTAIARWEGANSRQDQ